MHKGIDQVSLAQYCFSSFCAKDCTKALLMATIESKGNGAFAVPSVNHGLGVYTLSQCAHLISKVHEVM